MLGSSFGQKLTEKIGDFLKKGPKFVYNQHINVGGRLEYSAYKINFSIFLRSKPGTDK